MTASRRVTLARQPLALALLVTVAAGIGCAPLAAAPDSDEVVLGYDFVAGNEGWTAEIADYTETTRPDDLQAEVGATPPDMADAGSDHYLLAASNPSDDLFMYLWRQVSGADGLKPDTAYRVGYTVHFASGAPVGCGGVPEPPGESVELLVGVSEQEPTPTTDGQQARLPLKDAGSEAKGEVTAAGDIANGIACHQALDADTPAFAPVTLEAELDQVAMTGPTGELWLLVGADSRFDGHTALYLDRIEVTFEPMV